jgi:uncharacterized protein YecT (DUF1311 family)
MICNKAILALVMICPILIISPVKAAKSIDECQNNTAGETSPAFISSCLDGVISFVDRELQTWVNLHTFNLEEKALVNGRHSALKMFKRSQSNFITYRENDCRWQYLAKSPDRGADLAYKTCYVMLSQSRIMALSNINTTNPTP